MRNQGRLYWALVALQLLILLAMIGKQLWILDSGSRIKLRCRPVDPRSLFSGDYVILNYEISELGRRKQRSSLKHGDASFEAYDKVYVALEKEQGFHRAVAFAKTLEELKPEHDLVIRGRVRRYNDWSFSIRYGVEAFFVPQFAGKILEREMQKVSVELALMENGESAIAKVFIEGQEVEFH